MTNLCSFCFRQSLPMEKNKTENTCFWKKKTALFCFARQRCFFFQLSKMKKSKNKQTRSQVFFLFVKTTILSCQTIKHFFVSQLSKINKPLVEKKSNSFFLLKKLRRYKKQCDQRFVTKSNGQFHFFVTPTHQVMIVITNFNVFEHPPTQV